MIIMQTINDKLMRCLHLQDSFNSAVNPEWKTAGYAWNRAMWVEAAELADHYGYKWWKNINSAPDTKQILLELVDIFHFLLSDLMIRRRLTGSEHAANVLNAFAFAKAHSPKNANKETVLKTVETFVEDCVTNEYALNSYFRMVVVFGFTLEDIVDYYLGKNVLNLFRYDNGYKTGEYKKIWNGVEDNKVLEEILDTGERDFETIYRKLQEVYTSL